MWRLKRCSVNDWCRWFKPSLAIHMGPCAECFPAAGTFEPSIRAFFSFWLWNPLAAVAAIIMSAIRTIHGLSLPPRLMRIAEVIWEPHPEKAYSARRSWKDIDPYEAAGSAGLWQC